MLRQMWVGDGISASRASEDTLRENIEVISGCDMLFILQLSVHETEMSLPEESRFWRDAIFSAREKFGFYSNLEVLKWLHTVNILDAKEKDKYGSTLATFASSTTLAWLKSQNLA